MIADVVVDGGDEEKWGTGRGGRPDGDVLKVAAEAEGQQQQVGCALNVLQYQ